MARHTPKMVRSLQRDGFSLLEMILALAILGGSLAIIGEVMRNAVRNATTARDTTVARLLCESRMTEVETGVIPLETVVGASFDGTYYTSTSSTLGSSTAMGSLGSVDPMDSEDMLEMSEDWLYSIEIDPIDDLGLVEVRVTVSNVESDPLQPVEFSLVRWMVDQEAIDEMQAAAESGEVDDSGMSTDPFAM